MAYAKNKIEAIFFVANSNKVLVQARFGLSEMWVKIRKTDAVDLIQTSWSEDETCAELADDGILYLS